MSTYSWSVPNPDDIDWTINGSGKAFDCCVARNTTAPTEPAHSQYPQTYSDWQIGTIPAAEKCCRQLIDDNDYLCKYPTGVPAYYTSGNHWKQGPFNNPYGWWKQGGVCDTTSQENYNGSCYWTGANSAGCTCWSQSPGGTNARQCSTYGSNPDADCCGWLDGNSCQNKTVQKTSNNYDVDYGYCDPSGMRKRLADKAIGVL